MWDLDITVVYDPSMVKPYAASSWGIVEYGETCMQAVCRLLDELDALEESYVSDQLTPATDYDWYDADPGVYLDSRTATDIAAYRRLIFNDWPYEDPGEDITESMPMSPETVEKLAEVGIDLPTWTPDKAAPHSPS